MWISVFTTIFCGIANGHDNVVTCGTHQIVTAAHRYNAQDLPCPCAMRHICCMAGEEGTQDVGCEGTACVESYEEDIGWSCTRSRR